MRFLDRFRRKAPPLRDYLYVDRKRLDSYLEQISSTSTYDRVPSLGVGVSPAGPSVSAQEPRVRRDKSDHEKVCELIAYLERHGHLRHRRPVLIQADHEDLALPDFVLEQCDAVRILIPAAASDGDPGVVVWVSEWPIERDDRVLRPAGLLCIIQDSTFDDSRHRAGFEHSSYTWLQALLHQLHQQPLETKLAAQYPSSLTGDYRFDLMVAQDHLRSEIGMLRTNPLAWLTAKGCVLSLPRRITALYRIRNLGGDEIDTKNRFEDFTISTFAYGIAVWAQPNITLDPSPTLPCPSGSVGGRGST
jgi:hypothetical protein